MSSRLIGLSAVIIGFSVLSALAVMEVGYFGILKPHFQSWGGAQVSVDLVILAVLACVWMVRDARQSGVSPWPFILITLVAGSFGPLLYMVTRELRGTDSTSRAGRIGVS